MKLLAVAVLALSLAQILPSCGGSEDRGQVVGWVEAKRFDRFNGDFVLVINGHEYNTSSAFWSIVEVGDLVKWDGFTWTIVRKGSATPTPSPRPAPSPTPTPQPSPSPTS